MKRIVMTVSAAVWMLSGRPVSPQRSDAGRGTLRSLLPGRPGGAGHGRAGGTRCQPPALAHDVRYTENGQTLRLNDGLWETADGLSNYTLYLADPESGAAAFMGTIRESSREAMLALRLKVIGRKISEIEAVISRTSGLRARLESTTPT